MAKTPPLRLLWLQSGGCGGCTMSLIGAQGPDLLRSLEIAGVEIAWHPSLSEETGSEAARIINAIADGREAIDIVCLEGSVMTGPDGTGMFHRMAGSDQSMMSVIDKVARRARYVVAVGSCAAFGGITAAGGNEVGAIGLAYDGKQAGGLLGADFRSGSGLPVINISGCPIHPDWFTDTIMQIGSGAFDARDMDDLQRPLSFAGHLVHHGCSRNEFYEFKASAEKLCDMGCMMENLGCKGTQARADCNIRAWNGSGSCLDGNYPCINCTAPEFEEPGHGFTKTPKISGIPIGLPTDMPKAWFVALASLSKAATPERLKRDATSDRLGALGDGKRRK